MVDYNEIYFTSTPERDLQFTLFQANFSTSTSSIASDATAPNLPGPGRIVGNLFERLGARPRVVLECACGTPRP